MSLGEAYVTKTSTFRHAFRSSSFSISESKSFFAAEHALRMQLASDAHSQGAAMAGDMAGMQSKNLYTSKLEEMLGLGKESSAQSSITPKPVKDFVLRPASASVASQAADLAGGPSTLENNDGFDQTRAVACASESISHQLSARREMVVTAACTTSEEAELRVHHGPHSSENQCHFQRPPVQINSAQPAHTDLPPVIYDPNRSAHAARAPHALPKNTFSPCTRPFHRLTCVVTRVSCTRALPQQWT